MIVGPAYHRCSRRRLRHVSSNGEIAASCAGKAYFLRVKISPMTLPFQESRATDGGECPERGSGEVKGHQEPQDERSVAYGRFLPERLPVKGCLGPRLSQLHTATPLAAFLGAQP